MATKVLGKKKGSIALEKIQTNKKKFYELHFAGNANV